ncbi:MAG TPA: hypothetical protein VGU46_10245 [Acidobacteriaceae bacterium]|nr:hypothetical protein [Acidobacteriaceae bacterium]
MQELIRFLVGGVVVSGFAAISECFRPKSFAGLFGAAPSIALATLGLTVVHSGKMFAAVEARSMIFGAAAFVVYACLCSRVLMGKRLSALVVTVMLLPVWFGVSFGLMFLFRLFLSAGGGA